MDSHVLESLSRAVRDARDSYRELLSQGRSWDYLVLTASNNHQAEGYRLELERRRQERFLPEATRLMVLPDPNDIRVGSGGATLWAVRSVARDIWLKQEPDSKLNPQDVFRGRRILIVHSGGDSRRIPHCSPTGKIFLKLPILRPDGSTSSLFDEVIMSVSPLCEHMTEGLVVLSGDVLLSFAAGDMPTRTADVLGVACKEEVSTASRHGVYVLAQDGSVADFLQKPDAQQMRQRGALDGNDRALVDTGILFFSPAAAAGLASLAGVSAADGRLLIAESPLRIGTDSPVAIDLYSDVPAALLPNPPEGNVHAEPWVDQLLRRSLSSFEFKAWVADPCDFMHIGTTAQFREAFTTDSVPARLYGFTLNSNFFARDVSLDPGVAIHDSILQGTAAAEVDSRAVIHDADLRGEFHIAEGAVISGVQARQGALNVRANTVVTQVPIRFEARPPTLGPPGAEAVVTQVYGVNDNPKDLLEGGTATLFGQDLKRWLQDRGISAEDVWPHVPSDRRSLWSARLYPASSPPGDLSLVLWMQDEEEPAPEVMRVWRGSPRLSMEDTARLADRPSSLESARVLGARRKALDSVDLVATGSDRPPLEQLKHIDDLSELLAALDELESSLPGLGDPLQRMRLWRLMSDLLTCREKLSGEPADAAPSFAASGLSIAHPHVRLAHAVFGKQAGRKALATMYEEQVFGALAQLLQRNFEPLAKRPACALQAGESIEVRCPVRVDLAGGWTDTPPYCLERGGIVLNLALDLEGRPPVSVRARPLEQRLVRLCSVDQQHEQVFTDIEGLLDYANPADSLAILKASLVLAGVIPQAADQSLSRLLEHFGAGIEVTMDVDVPKGSGLGTSSIAAAAAVGCAAALVGLSPTTDELFDAVLTLEQMLTTGGGWQDQVGGIVPGVKVTTTRPGVSQKAQIEPLELAPEVTRLFQDRFLLFYTGRTRIAKNILRTVVSRWIRRSPQAVRALDGLKEIAHQMRSAFLEGDLDEVGRLMRKQWEANKILDPQSTGPRFDKLFDLAEPYVSGAKLAGAGGGGFMALMLRQDADRRKLERTLLDWSGPRGKITPCSLSPDGLRIRVVEPTAD